jgi:hypothetical protein
MHEVQNHCMKVRCETKASALLCVLFCGVGMSVKLLVNTDVTYNGLHYMIRACAQILPNM